MLWRKIKQSNKKEYWGVEFIYCGQGRLLWQWGAGAEPPGSEDEPFGNLGKEYARQRAKEGQRTWGAGALGYSKASTHPSGCRECLWSRLRLSLSDLPLANKVKVTPSSGAATSNELGDEGREVPLAWIQDISGGETGTEHSGIPQGWARVRL